MRSTPAPRSSLVEFRREPGQEVERLAPPDFHRGVPTPELIAEKRADQDGEAGASCREEINAHTGGAPHRNSPTAKRRW